MDSSAFPWLSETGLDNLIITDQTDFTDSIDEELAAILGEDFESCLSPENCSSHSSTLVNVPSASSISSFPASSTPIVLSFGNATSPRNPGEDVSRILRSQSPPADSKESRNRAENMKRTSRARPPSQIYDHIIAERKRRQQLNQHFLALSTIVPSLKKLDKTSVLGDAISYLRHLQERVKALEEEVTKKSMESVVVVRKSKIAFEHDDDDRKYQCLEEQPLPEIEASVCDTQILIRIQCENRKGLLVDLIGLAEKLNLIIVNANATAFGMFALEITIITKMEKEFNLTVNEVLKRLHAMIKHVKN